MTTQNNYSKFYNLYYLFKRLYFSSIIVTSIIASFTFTPYLFDKVIFYFTHDYQYENPSLSNSFLMCSIFSFMVCLVFSSLKGRYLKLIEEIENGKPEDYRTVMRKKRVETYKKLREKNPDFENLNDTEKYKIVKKTVGSLYSERIKCELNNLKKNIYNI